MGARNAPLAVETSVTEFRKLNDAARRYAERAESSFERQKQFIGNASHEMQTPLAVCRNRLEMLVDDAHALTGEQLGEIAKVQRTLDYLVRLNRSLLLLSKIDNGQFPEAEEVDVNALVRRTAEDMEEIYAYRSHALCARGRGAAHGADESVAGRERGRQPAEKRIRSRRRGRRGDGAASLRVASRSATAVRAVRSTPGVSSTGSIRERRRRVLRGWALPWSTQSAVSTG